MRHPFDGINDVNSPPAEPIAVPTDAAPATPSRRAMLGHMAMAAAAAMVEVNRAAAQPVPPGAGPAAHSGRWKHLNKAPGGPIPPNEEGILMPRPPAQSADLTDEQLKIAWKTLGEGDSNKARAASNLIFSAKKAVPFLKDQFKAIAGNVDEKKVAGLIKDLDADVFATRARASDDLLQMGPGILPHLQAALAANPPLELRRRLEMLQVKAKALPAYFQGQRGLQILAELPMKDAQETLSDIRKQSPETWLTKEAKGPTPAPNPPAAPTAPRPIDAAR